MSKQFWTETLTWATSDATAISNSTTETVVFPNVTIPANYMQDGRSLLLRAHGKHSTTATPTLQFFLRWGGVAGTVITKTGTITTGSGVTNALWTVEIEITTRSNGSSGTLMANGLAVVHSGTAPTVGSATGAAAVAPFTNGGQTVPAAVTLDLTADTALALSAQWSAASASNTLTGLQYYLLALN